MTPPIGITNTYPASAAVWLTMATKINIKGPLFGKHPCPPGEIWLRDSDIVLVPKHPILHADEAIDLVFTRGIYSVLPMRFNLSFSQLMTARR